jgi:GNAT superfamily N-acetyltransferase
VIVIRSLATDELTGVTAIDVTEDGTVVLEQHGTAISRRTEEWHRQPRTPQRWGEFAARWRRIVADGGLVLGAVDSSAGEALVGIATLRRSIRPAVDQLEALFVDRAHRRRGIARRLVTAVASAACEGGAKRLYVSATPSESAVGFYLERGFRPTAEPIPELLALEPEDIHMILEVTASGR